MVYNLEQMTEAVASGHPSRSRSSSCSSDDEQPEITLDDLSADTLAALKAHLAIKDAAQVNESYSVYICPLACSPAIKISASVTQFGAVFVSSVCRGRHSQRLRAL